MNKTLVALILAAATGAAFAANHAAPPPPKDPVPGTTQGKAMTADEKAAAQKRLADYEAFKKRSEFGGFERPAVSGR